MSDVLCQETLTSLKRGRVRVSIVLHVMKNFTEMKIKDKLKGNN